MRILLPIFVALVVACGWISSASAARSQSVSYRVSATLPEHPRIIDQTDAALITKLAKRFHIQQDQMIRNDRLVIVKSYTVK